MQIISERSSGEFILKQTPGIDWCISKGSEHNLKQQGFSPCHLNCPFRKESFRAILVFFYSFHSIFFYSGGISQIRSKTLQYRGKPGGQIQLYSFKVRKYIENKRVAVVGHTLPLEWSVHNPSNASQTPQKKHRLPDLWHGFLSRILSLFTNLAVLMRSMQYV